MATLEEQIILAKADADAAKKKYDALVLKAKKNHEDGIVPVGDMALVIYTQRRLSTETFIENYEPEVYSWLYKMVPDTEAVRKELNEEEFLEVSSPVRALTVKTLDKALADEEEFKK